MGNFKVVSSVSETIMPVDANSRIVSVNVVCSPTDINGIDRPVTTAELDAIRGVVEAQLQLLGLETAAVSASAKVSAGDAPNGATLRIVVRHDLEAALG